MTGIHFHILIINLLTILFLAPLSLLDNTFDGFSIRIRLTRPSYEELDDFEGKRELSGKLGNVSFQTPSIIISIFPLSKILSGT